MPPKPVASGRQTRASARAAVDPSTGKKDQEALHRQRPTPLLPPTPPTPQIGKKTKTPKVTLAPDPPITPEKQKPSVKKPGSSPKGPLPTPPETPHPKKHPQQEDPTPAPKPKKTRIVRFEQDRDDPMAIAAAAAAAAAASSDEEDEENRFKHDAPQYLETYEHVRAGLIELAGSESPHRAGLIYEFAEAHFKFKLFSNDDAAVVERLCAMPVETALMVGCVSGGGPGEAKAWAALFKSALERLTLVCAVVGLVLNEHVFSSLCYGASDEQLKKMHVEIDVKKRVFPDDGFSRAQLRRDHIVKLLADEAKAAGKKKASDNDDALRATKLGLPAAFVPTTKRLAWQLYTILAPILALDAAWQAPTAAPASGELYSEAESEFDGALPAGDLQQREVVRALFGLVARAGVLALQMRLDGSTVYHAQTAFKEDFYDEGEMRALNRNWMVKMNPVARAQRAAEEAEEGAEVDAAVLEAARCELALVRTVIFPGWKAYKRGGWGAADKDRGVRVVTLMRAWVGLRWGRQRRWETEAERKEREGKEGRGEEVEKRGDEWEEWLMVWADRNKDKKHLQRIARWFDWNKPGEEFVSDDEGEGAAEGAAEGAE